MKAKNPQATRPDDAPRSRLARLCCLLVIALFLVMIIGEPAERQDSSATDSPAERGAGALFSDSIEAGNSPAHPGGGHALGNPYTLADGSVVRIHVAPQYQHTDLLQRVLATLNSLNHGREMRRLTVLISAPEALARTCGSANACYYPSDETMVLPGGQITNSMSFEMIVAHEYGHHLERNRSTGSWDAVSMGARHWATYQRVCEGVLAGQLFPGDEGPHYWENPGEAFAQTYAFAHYPNVVPWWWSFAEPDQGSYAAVAADVADATGGAKSKWARRMSAGRRRTVRTVSMPIDGELHATMKAPASSRFKLVAVAENGTVLSKARFERNRPKGGRRKAHLHYDVCGRRSVRLEVRRGAGHGRFVIKIDS